MKKTIVIKVVLLTALIPFLLGMSSLTMMTDAKVKNPVIHIENEPNLEIHEGYVSQKEETVLVKKGRKTIAQVYLSEPVMVAMAEQEEEWGFFQFPNIGIADDGTIVVSWQMKEDTPVTYGKKPSRKYSPMMSKDGGKTWNSQDKKYSLKRYGNYIELTDGAILQLTTPASKNENSLIKRPKVLDKKKRYTYFLAEDLPDELQGAYIVYQEGGKTELVHAIVIDPGLVRYSYDDLIPVIWKGTIKELSDHTLMAGIYPTCYLDSLGRVSAEGVSFYQSFDSGRSWKVRGKIPFEKEKLDVIRGGNGFTEPAFQIMADSTFLCIMRTGSTSPMYESFSTDFGLSWSIPKPITPNGVKPCVMALKNGVIVLTSGRPGIQIRFNLDGRGKTWTEPIDMIPFMTSIGTYNRDVSCGYSSLIGTDTNSFYLVYSDFTTKGPNGKQRKSIWFRKIQIENKYK